MIPKRMFFYWDKPYLSWMRYMTLYSFRKMNPSWEMVLCLRQDDNKPKKWSGQVGQDFLNYKGDNYFDRLSKLNIIIETVKFPSAFDATVISPIHESDLYRYYKLYNDGGFYSDMDILYFRSMDNIYNEILQCGANTVFYTQCDHTSIGFLGAEKDNLFYRGLMMFALDVEDVNTYQAYGTSLIFKFCKKYDIRHVVVDMYNDLVVFVIPEYLIYYYNSKVIEKAFSNSFGIKNFNDKSIGYHWYAGAPIAQKFNNLITENNYMNYKTTFSTVVKELLNGSSY